MNESQKKNIAKVIKELEGEYTVMFDSDQHIGVDIDQATIIRLIRMSDLNFYSGFKIPKVKPVTVEWLMERIHKADNVEYINHTKLFEKLNEKLGMKLTPTSYGLGMESIFVSHTTMHEMADTKKEILDAHNIEYTIDVSEASWVFRFRISKSSKNIDRINSIIT